MPTAYCLLSRLVSRLEWAEPQASIIEKDIMSAKPSAIVLLSGGLDSATVLAGVHAEGYRIQALSFSYGQRHALELKRAAQLAAHYAHRHIVLELDTLLFRGTALVDRKVEMPLNFKGDRGIPLTYVPARNILFLAHALALAESSESYDIFLGVNAVDYSGYPDCRPEFLQAFREMARLGMRCGVEGKPVHIHAPLLYLSKKEIIQKGISLGLDYRLTSSCYDPGPDGVPCQSCDSCLLRARGFAEAGLDDPLLSISNL